MSKFVPYKVVGQLVVQELDEDGHVVSEQVVGNLQLFAHQFGDLGKKVEEAWPEVEAALGGAAG